MKKSLSQTLTDLRFAQEERAVWQEVINFLNNFIPDDGIELKGKEIWVDDVGKVGSDTVVNVVDQVISDHIGPLSKEIGEIMGSTVEIKEGNNGSNKKEDSKNAGGKTNGKAPRQIRRGARSKSAED